MRLQTILGMALCFVLPASLWAKSYDDMAVKALDGTIMVQHADNSQPVALQTDSIMEKGDTITVYDQSWLILKSRKGDLIGLDGYNGSTVMIIEECFTEGPDRQFRLILKQGSLILKTNGCDSRQSFFEINSGSFVTSVNNVRAILTYTPAQSLLKTQYLRGKMSVIDKNTEHRMTLEHTENHWQNGLMVDEKTQLMDETDVVNFDRFFDGKSRLTPPDNNILLRAN